jgi:hypothetical protein
VSFTPRHAHVEVSLQKPAVRYLNPIGFTVSVPIHLSIQSIETRLKSGDANFRSHEFHDGCAVQRIEMRCVDDSTGFAKPIQ